MANDENIVRYTAAELAEMRARGETLSDFARVAAMTDDELERILADDPDWADLSPDWTSAVIVMPGIGDRPLMPIDQDVVQWFRDQGPGYQTRINAVLRAFVQDQTKKRA
ncbi:BrnA antitoxin family protein [Acidisoma silvae]|uniref:BrnA antitoxin family protein n=1 Tax=Acidisoma silvae TaxID=2802396 RepID=A0A964DXH7_9PROT|nr:BrnA antitoxin family protein [Acidisoma silvae]MCB8873708.1 BrnA antitoxin family protein [Acidisoma silvae]